jgi:hypothetical protein
VKQIRDIVREQEAAKRDLSTEAVLMAVGSLKKGKIPLVTEEVLEAARGYLRRQHWGL